jgi:hypothetical protein
MKNEDLRNAFGVIFMKIFPEGVFDNLQSSILNLKVFYANI